MPLVLCLVFLFTAAIFDFEVGRVLPQSVGGRNAKSNEAGGGGILSSGLVFHEAKNVYFLDLVLMAQ